MRFILPILIFCLALTGRGHACAPPDAALTTVPSKLLHRLKKDSAPLLAAADTYSLVMEACYDGPMGPLELTPLIKQANAVAANMAALRILAEDEVRDNEMAYEDLLSSELWGDIESLRVASAYGAAWGELAVAVRHIAANDKRKAMRGALATMRSLTFEFKHPVLVQRAMYGLATAQVESGDVTNAKQTLQRLRQSLRQGGAPDFKNAIDDFHARITAPDYTPPVALFAPRQKAQALKMSDPQRASALRLARQALTEGRPAVEITALLRPIFSGADTSAIKDAFKFLASDQLLLNAMDFEPGPSLQVMKRAFGTGHYGQLLAAWRGVKAFHPHMPVGLKRQVDYQLGVAWLNRGELKQAIAHLWAARQAVRPGPMQERIDKLIALAQLSIDEPPTPARLELARAFKDIPPPPPRLANDLAPSLDALLGLRARVVLARAAAEKQDWVAADKTLTGIGPTMPGYALFLGMRVRLLAEAVRSRLAAGEAVVNLNKTARGALSLYNLWLAADCPPGCLRGARLPVHRAAIELTLSAQLPSRDFGNAFGRFAEEGGDIRPLLNRAFGFLVTAQDDLRLMALLEPADEAEAAQVLGFWKAYLAGLTKTKNLAEHYDWLALGLPDLQGRPQAVLLESLITHDLASARPVEALAHAETLARYFPRRPSAWFMRAAALEANQRGVEAARALSALARRTPADDPVGIGARLGLAAVFVKLERIEQACAMRGKIFSRPTANTNWSAAMKAFPMLGDWHQTTKAACS